jgi:signal transduction histidine kinase
MRIPAFVKTIRFKLTLWYLALFMLFFILLVGGINLAMHQFWDTGPDKWQDGKPPWQEMDEQGVSGETDEMDRLLIYSLISLGVVPVLGFAGGYFLAGRMLKPFSRVSSLAARISSTNLKERINYHGSDDEIKRLAYTFDDMLSRLEVAFESQKQFIQDASHELRTPIATAQTNIEVTEMAEKVTASDYKRLMKVLKQSLERMTQLSDQLLLLADASQERANWQAVDIKSIISEVAAEVSARTTVAGINLELEPAAEEMMVKGDSLRLKQAVFNLVDNAIKYNQPGGTVKISARAEESRLVVQVQDNGIGISPADQTHIFDRFYRVDKSRTRSQGGSGLGLAIVKKIVEDHTGTISVESAMGKGSTFQIILPRYISA